MSDFPEYGERSPRTIWVGGIGLAPKKTRQILPPVIHPVNTELSVGPIDIDIHTELSDRRNLPEGGTKTKSTEIELGGYAVHVEVSIERLPKEATRPPEGQ